MKTLSESPKILLIENFLSEDEINHLIVTGTPKLERSQTVDPVTGKGSNNSYRTGRTAMFAKSQDLTIKAVEKRIAALAQVRVEQLEFINLNRYDVGDEFKVHTDWFAPEAPQLVDQFKYGGQRIASLIIYLNEPEEGGETQFTEIGITQKPIKGAAVYWSNLTDGVPDVRTMHCGKPVLKGEKWLITCWIRERAFDGSEEATYALQKKAQAEASKNAAEDEDALRKKIADLQADNVKLGRAEILAVLERRKLILVPKAVIADDGRVAAVCDIVPNSGGS